MGETPQRLNKCEANTSAVLLMCFLTPGPDAPSPPEGRKQHSSLVHASRVKAYGGRRRGREVTLRVTRYLHNIIEVKIGTERNNKVWVN